MPDAATDAGFALQGAGIFRGNEMVEYSVATRFARVYQPYRGGVRLSLPECLEPYAVRRGAPYGGRNSYRRSAIHGRQNLMSGINARPATG